MIFKSIDMVWWNNVNDICKTIPITAKQHVKVNSNKQSIYIRKLEICYQGLSVGVSDKIKISNNEGSVLNPNVRQNENKLQSIEMFGKIAKLSFQTEEKLPTLEFYSQIPKKILKYLTMKMRRLNIYI